MRRFIYASRWSEAVQQEPDLALQQIVAKSIQNNRIGGLTGFLLAFDGVFLQVLEGPKAEIDAAYDRIRSDPRHQALTVIADHPTEKRAFHDWNMCGVRLGAADAVLSESRMTQVASAGEGFDPEAALKLLQAVASLEAERERKAALSA